MKKTGYTWSGGGYGVVDIESDDSGEFPDIGEKIFDTWVDVITHRKMMMRFYERLLSSMFSAPGVCECSITINQTLRYECGSWNVRVSGGNNVAASMRQHVVDVFIRAGFENVSEEFFSSGDDFDVKNDFEVAAHKLLKVLARGV